MAAVKARDVARAQRDRVPALVESMVGQIKVLHATLPGLEAALCTCEDAVRKAMEANGQATRVASGVAGAAGPEVPGDEDMVAKLQRQIHAMWDRSS